MPIYKKRSFGAAIMVLLIAAGSIIGCFTTLNGMYSDVLDVFEDGADQDDECVQEYLIQRADIGADICKLSRKYLDSSKNDTLITALSDAAGDLKIAADADDDELQLADLKTKNDALSAAMNDVYSALRSTSDIPSQDKLQYRDLYAEFESLGDMIRNDPYNTAALEYNNKTSGPLASLTKKITPAHDAVMFS